MGLHLATPDWAEGPAGITPAHLPVSKSPVPHRHRVLRHVALGSSCLGQLAVCPHNAQDSEVMKM